MKKSLILLLTAPLLLLSACTEEQKTTQPTKMMSKSTKVQSESVKIDVESTLNIVFLYEPYKKYLQASLKTNDPEVDKKNYAKYVLSYIDKIGEKEQFATADLKAFPMLQSTTYEQELLDKIENLMKQQDDITKIIKKNYIASHKILPKKKSTIIVAPVNPESSFDLQSMKGVSGAAYKDAFILYLDTNYDQDVLAYSTAHEYHHLVLMDTPDFSLNTTLDSAIVEGKADAFADRIVKGVSIPWNVEMDEATKKHVVHLVNSYEVSQLDFVVGNEQKEIPRWSNYMLGRDILNHYFESHPDQSIAEWTYTDQADILKGYKYQKVLEQ
ncbi:DUF2268 domain-containing protein [Exiguobacterium sp. R-17]|uniref:DUF2268 domain-containing protein n=1 Tax=Exiguobacterium sp. R-17 TaxID=3404054 RepID=UPI003CF02EBC